MGLEAASSLGGWLLRTLGPITGTQKTVMRNLRIAFPEMDAAARRQLALDQWEQTGRTFAETAVMDRLTPASGRIDIVGAERLEAIRASGKPVVFVSGHLANIETMAAVLVASGIPVQVTYRAANNPYVDAQIRAARARYGIKLFAPKGGDGARELLDALGRGESVALMNDQKFNGGVAAPFFGRLAHTAPGPSRLALRFDTVLQPMSVQRLDKARFRVIVHPPIKPLVTGDRAGDIARSVDRINTFMEERIAERPAEWFWVHKRWPAETYARKRR